MYDENFYAKLQKEEEAQTFAEHISMMRKERQKKDPNWYEHSGLRSALTTKVY